MRSALMKSKSDIFLATKKFDKGILDLDAIIVDAACEEKSNKVKQFYNIVGKILRMLEERTPWANRVEFYVRILKDL